MRKVFNIISLLVVIGSVFVCSCKRDPIYYPVSNYYISIDTQYESLNPAASGTKTEVFTVSLYDKESGSQVFKTFVYPERHPSDMPAGSYLTGITPGDYYIHVYNYDTRNTRVNNDQNAARLFADTETYGYSANVPIIKMPDHLYNYFGEVSIPYVTDEDPVFMIETRPKSILETWKINVIGIRKIETAQAIRIYMSGQARGEWIGTNEGSIEGNSIILWEGHIPESTKSETGLDVYSEYYTTFGENPDGERCLLTIYITGPGGRVFWGQEDVSDKITEARSDGSYSITLEMDIEVAEREQSGFNPTADEWGSQHDEWDLN